MQDNASPVVITAKAHQQPFTGERYVPEVCGNIALEHLHRYAMAREIAVGKAVLDIACGEGYGSWILSEVAQSIIGVDVARDAILHAREKYRKENLEFRVGSCDRIPLPDRAVDLVVSFETIEHHDLHDAMMAEIKRVLRPGGTLIISSPDKQEYSDVPGYRNPFHVKELYRHELKQLIEAWFKHVALYGQRITYGSNIFLEEGTSPHLSHHWTRGKTITARGMPRPLYLIGIASDKELPTASSGVFEQPLDETERARTWSLALADRDGQIQQLGSRVQAAEAENGLLCDQIAAKRQEAEGLRSQKADLEGQIQQLGSRVQAAEAENGLYRDQLAAERRAAEEQKSRKAVADYKAADAERRASFAEFELRRAQHRPIRNLKRFLRWRTSRLILCFGLLLSRSLSMRMRRRMAKNSPFPQLISEAAPNVARTASPRQWGRRRLFLTYHVLRMLVQQRWLFSARRLKKLNKGLQKRAIALNAASLAHLVEEPAPPPNSLDASDIRICTSSEPRVSVIIPVYGKIDYTLQCLRSIAASPPKIPFEVIIVDDCSPDDTREILKHAHGIRVHSNDENLGFVRSCNCGAQLAQGKYLCFLNNDTEVKPSWLDELVRTFVEFPGTGLAGSKLIYPDGSLQEAGGIIWQDGSAWNFGRGQDAEHPIYNYARQVDYCSGASIMLERELFLELGGFDEHYAPAYCEDADIALKVRARGLNVIYQPLSIVIHHEGITSGTDTSTGVKAYQVENTRKMFERWKSRLARHEPNGLSVDSAKDRGVRLRALVLDHCTPTPDQDAGSLVTANMLLLLRQLGFQVTFIPEDNFLFMPPYTHDLQRAGIEVLYAPFVRAVEEHLKENGSRYDVVLIWRPVVAERHLNDVKTLCPRAKVLYGAIDLHYLRMTREAELNNDHKLKTSAAIMKKNELGAMASVDAVIVHSTAEKDIVKAELPGCNVKVIPLIMGVQQSPPLFAERRNIAFVGGFQHPPNVDAVRYFVSEIMPMVRKSVPGALFYAIGSNPPEEIRSLACEDVVVTGFVKDLKPLLDKMRVAVAPLRYGAGTKGKVATAMSLGLPCVVTSAAAEGMGLHHGRDVLLADNATSFAESINQVYANECLWSEISQNSLDYAESTFGPHAASDIMRRILTQLGIEVSAGMWPLRLIGPTGNWIDLRRAAFPQRLGMTPTDDWPPRRITAANGAPLTVGSEELTGGQKTHGAAHQRTHACPEALRRTEPH